MLYYIALIIAVSGSVLYHVSMKRIPSTANPFFVLLITYLCAAVVSGMGMLVFRDGTKGVSALTWANATLVAGILGIEIGFLLLYRTGWDLAIAAVANNACTAVILIPLGILLFAEHLTWNRALGLVLCGAGLTLLVQR